VCRCRQKIKVCSSKRGRDSFFKDDFFQSGKDSFNDAKDLFAEGEKLFKKGDFQQGQRLFQQAEQQLRQAKQQMPMQPFKSGNMDFRIPKIEVGGSQPSWKTSSLALFGIGAVATLVAGEVMNRRSGNLVSWHVSHIGCALGLCLQHCACKLK